MSPADRLAVLLDVLTTVARVAALAAAVWAPAYLLTDYLAHREDQNR